MGNNLALFSSVSSGSIPSLGSIPYDAFSTNKPQNIHENGKNLENYFYQLCSEGNIDSIRYTNFKKSWVSRGICYAISKNQIQMGEYLLNNHPEAVNDTSDPDPLDWRGPINVPLITALKAGNIDFVKLVLSRGANVNVYNHNGDPPLYLARRNLQMTKLLVKYGADINGKARDTGLDMIGYYMEEGPNELLEYALEQGVICPKVYIADHDSVTRIERKEKVHQYRTTQCTEYIIRLGSLLKVRCPGAEVSFYICDQVDHDFVYESYIMKISSGN